MRLLQNCGQEKNVIRELSDKHIVTNKWISSNSYEIIIEKLYE